ncbi:hypothetical protein J0B03_10285 [Alkalibacter rhizosphaerae]|uniref:Uncharacterized protein n=1 Tax=Alkalibacter rhizosphaerae TaxID=2815577 RepID=A0A974XG94_9FIRM|nr:hypothetical protein [Alkalibacter rhizosphaerae]QSX08175.1 hypothetical protein J0B03_10285 [Alkalibacter rhizosphaerae]
MKNPFRLSVLFLLGSAILAGSYFAGLQINEYLALDGFFEELTQPWVFHIISLKIIVMAFFIFFHGNRFRYLLNTVGLILANSAAFAFLDYHRSISDEYGVYLVIFGVELILFLLVGAVYNATLLHEEKQEESIPETPEVMMEEAPVETKEEPPVAMSDLEEKLENRDLDVDLEAVKYEDREPTIFHIANDAEDEKEYQNVTEINEKPNSCPIRVDIDMGDLKRYFEQYNRLNGKEEEIRFESKENEIQIKMEALSKKEKELNDRISVVKSKEKIIEKTIDNLEQISKTIKDRTNMLEEKEEYIKKQMDWIEQREDGYNAVVQNKIYDLFFEDLDLMDNEVLLKDEKREIIIDQSDLSEIRRSIEETMEAARKGMEQ